MPSCLRGSVIFSSEYFVGPKFSLAGISWVPNFLSKVFRRSETFFCGYLLGKNFFSWVFSQVQNYFTGKFRRYLVNIRVRNEK